MNISLVGGYSWGKEAFFYRFLCWLSCTISTWVRWNYFIVDIGEKGTDAESEGVLGFGGESQWEDTPWCCVGDNLILNVLILIGLCPHLCFHSLIIMHNRQLPTHTTTHNETIKFYESITRFLIANYIAHDHIYQIYHSRVLLLP